MVGLFARHVLAAIIIVVGAVVGLVIGAGGDWRNGIIIGVIIVGVGMLFGLLNLLVSARSFMNGRY